MTRLSKVIKPTNRHLTIVPHFVKSEEEKTTVLLPEEYKPKQEKFITATVLDVAPDCAQYFQKLRFNEKKQIVVDFSMIEKVRVFGKDYYLILENYVVGFIE